MEMGRRDRILRAPPRHPVRVAPGVLEIPDDRSGARRLLLQKSERDRALSTRYRDCYDGDVVFVNVPFADARNEPLPDSRTPPWF